MVVTPDHDLGEFFEKFTEDVSSQKTRTRESILNTAWSGVTTIFLLLFKENSIKLIRNEY